VNEQQFSGGLAQAVVDRNEEATWQGAQDAIERQFDPMAAVEQGLSQGMNTIGR